MAGRKTTGRRPADAGTPIRQDIWDAIRRRTDPFTISDVASATGAARKTIHDYLACLAAGGYSIAEMCPKLGRTDTAVARLLASPLPQRRLPSAPISDGQDDDEQMRFRF